MKERYAFLYSYKSKGDEKMKVKWIYCLFLGVLVLGIILIYLIQYMLYS